MENNSICPACGSALAPDAKFCRQCGTPSAASPSERTYSPHANARQRFYLPSIIGGVLLFVGTAGGLWYKQIWTFRSEGKMRLSYRRIPPTAQKGSRL